MKTEREMLKEANELIRSFNSVIEREGKDVNWNGLKQRVSRILQEQHKLKLFDIPVVSGSLSDFDSSKLIGNVNSKRQLVEVKKWDWQSFYNGWIEGRVDMFALLNDNDR